MKNLSNAALLTLFCAFSVHAEPLPHIGHWVPDEQAGTLLTIKENSLSWRGADKSAPACVEQYVLKPERPGSVYTNGRGTKFVAGVNGSLPTYLLKLGASTCEGIREEVRVSFHMVYDINHIEVIEYAGGKAVSARRFHREQRARRR